MQAKRQEWDKETIMNVLKKKIQSNQEGEGYLRVRTGEEARHWQKTLEKTSEKAQQRKSVSSELSFLDEHSIPSTINILIFSHWLQKKFLKFFEPATMR